MLAVSLSPYFPKPQEVKQQVCLPVFNPGGMTHTSGSLQENGCPQVIL